MSAILLPVIGALLVWSAVHRYRSDARALVGGIAAALGATVGASLVVPDVNARLGLGPLHAVGGIAVVLAVTGTIYGEARLKRGTTQ